jgi:hypothetical protein
MTTARTLLPLALALAFVVGCDDPSGDGIDQWASFNDGADATVETWCGISAHSDLYAFESNIIGGDYDGARFRATWPVDTQPEPGSYPISALYSAEVITSLSADGATGGSVEVNDMGSQIELSIYFEYPLDGETGFMEAIAACSK